MRISYRKKKPGIIYKGEEITNINAVISRGIGASVTFFTETRSVRQFEMMKVFSATESQALVRSRDKLRSLQILSRAVRPYPKIFVTMSKEELYYDKLGCCLLMIKLLECELPRLGRNVGV